MPAATSAKPKKTAAKSTTKKTASAAPKGKAPAKPKKETLQPPMERGKLRAVQLTRVIDGDTVEVEMGVGWFKAPARKRIRLWGIDAPESSQKNGKESTKHLQKLIGSRRKIYLEAMALDQYGRTVGVIYPGKSAPGHAYNCRMLADGWAHSYMLSKPYKDIYARAEAQAKAKHKGMWKQEKRGKSLEAPGAFRKKEQRKQERRHGFKGWFWVITLLLLAGIITYAVATRL